MGDMDDIPEDAADRLARCRVVALPDLFLDHVVPVGDGEAFLAEAAEVRRRGGGNIRTVAQELRPGGNAANTALGLARLGVPTTLVAATDGPARLLLERAAEDAPLDLDSVAATDRPARTVALESTGGARGTDGTGANVMLSDAGYVAGFGPEDVPDAAWEAIASADAVLVANWSQTRSHGTRLLEAVVEAAPPGAVYMDTGDMSRRGDALRGLLSSPALPSLGTWAMNENEARTLVRALGMDTSGKSDGKADARMAPWGTALAARLGIRIDLHTGAWAGSFRADEAVEARGFEIKAKRLTGAGDAWNAGNITASLLGLDHRARLRIAHGVAALSLRSPAPPRLDDLRRWSAEAVVP